MSSRNKKARRAQKRVAQGALCAGTLLGYSMLAGAADVPEEIEVRGQSMREGLGTRYTAPLLETPQTITLMPREIIDQQNLLTMKDILSTLPGITFSAGEGGGGYGDGINLRGYSASNDISTDGVRDSAQYTRSDPFNLEQLELVSGSNSVYTGAGSVGGSINLVTKTPTGREDTVLNVGAGTDSYSRLTLDAERSLGDLVDARLNLMVHENDAPGRDVETFERWGVAPSLAFSNRSGTRMTLAYLHQEDDNIPQYGVPYALGPFNDGAIPGVAMENYYGYRNVDRQESTVDAFTATINHMFTGNFSVRNLTRLQQVDQFLVVDPPQGSWCTIGGINPWNGTACTTPDSYTPSGPRGNVRDTSNEIFANQTDFTADFVTGSVQHTLVSGFSISRETYHRNNGNVLRNPLGATPNPALPTTSITNPDNFYTGPQNLIVNQKVDGEVDNRAVYVFDRAQLTQRFELNGGLRYESNDAHSTTGSIATPYPAPPAQPVLTQGPFNANKDNLFSYRVGLVFKPTEDSSLYLAQGNSQTPSMSTVSGACDSTRAERQNCNVDPEEGKTLEFGGKWDLSGRLSLNGAIFRNERTNFRVNSGDPAVPEQQLDGSSVVDGISLGAAGTITDRWQVFANYTYLDSEVEQSVSDIALGGGAIDIQAGDPLPNTPEHSGSFWTTYQVTDKLSVGYGATYQGEYTFTRTSATAELYYTPDYWVHRAMATYTFSERMSLQLNVNNLTDEEYFERIRNNANNGWATPGAARSAVLSFAYRL